MLNNSDVGMCHIAQAHTLEWNAATSIHGRIKECFTSTLYTYDSAQPNNYGACRICASLRLVPLTYRKDIGTYMQVNR